MTSFEQLLALATPEDLAAVREMIGPDVLRLLLAKEALRQTSAVLSPKRLAEILSISRQAAKARFDAAAISSNGRC
jgi:hypothetical protein